MPSSRTDLPSFAAALGDRLPGTWTSEYHRHAAYEDQFPLAEQVWDLAHVDWAVSEFVLQHDAVLIGPDEQRLYVIDRPLHRDQFLVAPLEPDDDQVKSHHFVGVSEPNGIAVPADPVRAAMRVARRLLPRYQRALIAVFDNALSQPEPPHRPAPPQVSQVVTLTWYDDGALGVPYASVPEEARMPLYAHGFQYHPHQAAFLLPAAYGDTGRALRIQAVAQQLAAHGIGVNLRHFPAAPAAAQPALTARPAIGPAVPSPTSSALHR
ncbi:hypothetical protein [Streptomyces chattanoogensis]|uniref:Uncharacterized protein n=1 Tax=Streptomyces chattanoogensis TaxID=66876 RepID=A0A0N1JX77_9ACTN|nr:hypothetical protein [Streptomyces chattanoogensis]KPC62653.1 hypothetical protein ADL29_18060 [Streptomyces chattanoogensis]